MKQEDDILIVVSLAVTPHANLIKVMKAEAPRDGVEQI